MGAPLKFRTKPTTHHRSPDGQRRRVMLWDPWNERTGFLELDEPLKPLLEIPRLEPLPAYRSDGSHPDQGPTVERFALLIVRPPTIPPAVQLPNPPDPEETPIYVMQEPEGVST